MAQQNNIHEFDFSITRTQGLIGLRVKKDILANGNYTCCLTVIGFIEPCMVSQLGYLEIGDEILTIDGKGIKSEADINFVNDRVDVDLVTLKVRRHNYDETDELMKKYGAKYLQQIQLIDALKLTLRKDHIDLASATLQLAIIIVETGDYKSAQGYLEEALNNAYGTAAGINSIVALCYCTQAHISYKLKKYPDARRQLWEAVEIFKKLGNSAQFNLLQTYQKLLSVADAQESAEDREFTKKKLNDLQQLILTDMLHSTSIPDLYQFGTLLVDGGDLDDARDQFERICKLYSTSPLNDKTQKEQYFNTLLSLISLRLTMKKYDLAHHEGKILTQLLSELYPENGSTTSSVFIDPSSLTANGAGGGTTTEGTGGINYLENINYNKLNAMGVVGMTMIWNETSDHERAKEYLLQSLRVQQLCYGKIHTSVAFLCHLLAIVYRKMNQFHQALHYHHMAIRIYEILLGEKNLITVSCVGELGISIQSRASFQMDVSEQIIDNMFVDMKRSNQNPYNSLQLYSCPLVRSLFYDHYNEVNRRSLPPVNKTDNKSSKSLQITGEGEGPAAFLIERGNILFHDECDYNSARVLFQQCYNYLCNAIGSTSNLTLLTLYRLADSTRELGNYKEANLLYEQAINQYLANAGDRVGLAYAYYGWGESLLLLGNLTQSKQYYTESLNILRNQIQLGNVGGVAGMGAGTGSGSGSIQTYPPEIGLIKVLIIECKWSEAIRQLERLINKIKGDLGSNSLLLAQVCLLLARCKRGKGLYSEIKASLDQAFVILRQCVTEDHLYFGHALYELSEYYRIMGDIKLAKEKYELTLPIYESYYTTEHDMVYKCRTSIALFSFDLGHINTSLNSHTEILKGRERLYGLFHPLIGESHLYIGDCLRILGHYNPAMEHYDIAENLIKSILTNDHPLFASLRYSQAELLRAHGFMERSRMFHAEAMKIRREMYGKEHPEYIQSMQGKADLDSNCDSNMEEIITLLKRIYKAKKKLYTEDHTTIADTLNTYGLVLRQQGKYHEALEKFQEALKLRQDIGDPNHYAIGEIRNNIALVQASMVEGGGTNTGDENEDQHTQHQQQTQEDIDTNIRYTHDGKQIYDPKPPVEHYEGVTDITPVFINTKYRKAIEEMNEAIAHILHSFPGTAQYQHPTIANIKGNIGLIERLEDEGKRDFILRLTAKQRALFREAEEKRLTEEFANMSGDFSDATAGSVKLLEAIDYFHAHGYDSYHPWLRKFESLVIKNLKEIPSDAEPQNAQQLKANRKLLEARDRMKRRLYHEAKKYYEETLQRLPEGGEGTRPDDLLSYAMTGECYNGLADISRIQCKLNEAKEFYQKSLLIFKKINGNETLQYADTLLGYTDLLTLEGEYTQSTMNIDEVIVIKKRLLGEKHESIVDCLFKRCVLYIQFSKYQEAYELCEYILDARLKFTQTHEDFDLTIQIAETYNLLAEIYLLKGDYERCEQSLQMTFKTCRKSVVLDAIHDEDHDVLAESYHLKGLCRLKQNKFKDALRNFGHSLSMKMRILQAIKEGRSPILEPPNPAVEAVEDTQNNGNNNGSGNGNGGNKALDPMEYCHVSVAVSLYGQAEALRRDGNYQIAADLYLKSIRLYSHIFQGQDNPAVANVMFGQAENYRLFGKFDSSEKIYQTVLSMRQRLYSNHGTSDIESHPDIADSYIGLGCQRYDQCRFQDSLIYFDKALTIKKLIYGNIKSPPPLSTSTSTAIQFNSSGSLPSTPLTPATRSTTLVENENIEIGKIYLYMGMVHMEMGQYDHAERYFNTSLTIHKGYYPENHPVICLVLFQQAKLFQIQQRYHDSHVLLTLIISIISMAYGEGHPEVGIHVITLSLNHLYLGNYSEGKISAQRGLQIFNKIYGADHPNTIRALLCIAKSLYQSGKYNKSLPYFQRSLDFMLRTFPSAVCPHLLVADCYYELGNCLLTLGRYVEARESFQQSFNLRKLLLFHEHVDTLIVWSAIGEVEMCLGNLTLAEQILVQVTDILYTSIGNKLSLLQCINMIRLGNIIEKKGKIIQSKQLYERGLYIQQRLLDHDHPTIAQTYCHIGRILIALGKYDLAKGYYEKSQTILLKFYRESHPILSYSVYGIAQCTRLMGYTAQAQGLYIKAITSLINELGIDHPDYYLMLIGFAENRRDEGYIYPVNSELYVIPILDLTKEPVDPFLPPPNSPTTSASSPLPDLAYDLSNPEYLFNHLHLCYAYPIIVKSYLYFYQRLQASTSSSSPSIGNNDAAAAPSNGGDGGVGGDSGSGGGGVVSPLQISPSYTTHHYIIIEIKSILSRLLYHLGLFSQALSIQKDLLSLTKYHYNKEYQYMSSVLFNLAEIELAMGKLSAKKKLFTGSGKPDLSVEAITGDKNRQKKQNKLRHQKILLSSSQPILPKIQPITAEKSRVPTKKKVLGYMGYQYPDIKTNDLDPTSPIDHLILNEIEVALREKEPTDKNSHQNDPAINMINEPKRLYDIALQLHIECYPDYNEHPFTGDIYYSRAELHRSRHEYEDAYIFYKKSLTNRLKTLRNNHPLIALTLFGLAENYRQSGNMKDAKVYYDQSLLIRIELYEKGRVLSHHKLLPISSTNPSPSQSLLHPNPSLDILSGYHSTPDSHLDIAQSQYGLSCYYYDMGSYSQSLQLCQESLLIRQAYHGPYHHLPLLNQQLLAHIHYNLQNYSLCHNIYQLILPIYKILYPSHHHLFISCLIQYSNLLKSQGMYQKSLKLFSKILSSQHHIYGTTHPEVAITLYNIGSIYSLLGNYNDSLKYHQQSYEMKLKCYERVGGVGGGVGGDSTASTSSGSNTSMTISSSLALSLYALAGVYYNLHNHPKALELYYETLEIQSSLYENNYHIHYANTLNNISLLLIKLQQYSESEVYLMKSLMIKEYLYKNGTNGTTTSGDTSMSTSGSMNQNLSSASTCYNLGILYQLQNKLSQAKKYYLKCYQTRLEVYGMNLKTHHLQHSQQQQRQQQNVEIKNCENNLKLIKLSEIINIEKSGRDRKKIRFFQ